MTTVTSGSPLPDFLSDGEQLSKSAHKWQWQHYDLKIHVCIGSTGSGSSQLFKDSAQITPNCYMNHLKRFQILKQFQL